VKQLGSFSGENTQRLGNITKAGSGMARWLLAHAA
jgi:hypothetical protein